MLEQWLLADDRVSIHAPGRGATVTKHVDLWREELFQFTHPGGVRRTPRAGRPYTRGFNSRTREGCDTQGDYPAGEHPGFNSRTREGCDTAGKAL